MPNKNISKKLFFLLSLSIAACLPLIVLAITPQLKYPKIMGIDIDQLITGGTITLTDLGRYIYYFFVIVGGVAAFIGLGIGGFKWLTSAGSPGKVSEARNQILFSFIGIILLLGSWIVLYTLDPQFTIFFPFKPQIVQSPLQASEEIGLTDGIIFKGNHFKGMAGQPLTKDPFEIDIPHGEIQRIQNTKNFPTAEGPVNLGGELVINKDGTFGGGEITKVEFRNPTNPQTGNPSYYYGAVCFERSNFHGSIRIVFSNNPKEEFSFVIPRPGADNLRCQSILIFRMPRIPIYSEGDRVVFYQYRYPKREKLEPINPGQPLTIGNLKRVIIGGCLKIDSTEEPEGCKELRTGLGNITMPTTICKAPNWIFLKLPGFIPGLAAGSLYAKTKDSKTGNETKWYPMSMEVRTDRAGKYLIFLFQKDPGTSNECHWDLGDAYWLQTDVLNFASAQDERLYWVSQPSPQNSPRSYIILQVTDVF